MFKNFLRDLAQNYPLLCTANESSVTVMIPNPAFARLGLDTLLSKAVEHKVIQKGQSIKELVEALRKDGFEISGGGDVSILYSRQQPLN